MIIFVIYLIFSFILDGFMSNIFPSTFSSISYLSTIYIVIALTVIFPYFYNYKKYYILILIFGILFDLLYSPFLFLNLFIFVVLSFVIRILNNIFPENIFTSNVISIVIVIVYHALSFVILGIFSDVHLDIVLLGRIITHSIIMSIIYTMISYLVLKFVTNKFGIKQMK